MSDGPEDLLARIVELERDLARLRDEAEGLRTGRIVVEPPADPETRPAPEPRRFDHRGRPIPTLREWVIVVTGLGAVMLVLWGVVELRAPRHAPARQLLAESTPDVGDWSWRGAVVDPVPSLSLERDASCTVTARSRSGALDRRVHVVLLCLPVHLDFECCELERPSISDGGDDHPRLRCDCRPLAGRGHVRADSAAGVFDVDIGFDFGRLRVRLDPRPSPLDARGAR